MVAKNLKNLFAPCTRTQAHSPTTGYHVFHTSSLIKLLTALGQLILWSSEWVICSSVRILLHMPIRTYVLWNCHVPRQRSAHSVKQRRLSTRGYTPNDNGHAGICENPHLYNKHRTRGPTANTTTKHAIM